MWIVEKVKVKIKINTIHCEKSKLQTILLVFEIRTESSCWPFSANHLKQFGNNRTVFSVNENALSVLPDTTYNTLHSAPCE